MGFLLAGTIMVPVAASAQSQQSFPSDQSVATGADQPAADIIVTANKRDERELDVAGALKAFNGDQLLAQGISSIKEYAQLTPGLQINTTIGNGAPIIRGISTGSDGGTLAAIIVDGAQLGSSATFGTGASDSLDLDPIDLQRVEVLKGPQGTLYGANTLSGLVSYTLRAPDLQKVTGIARGGIDFTEGGAASWSLRGAVSVPLAQDKLAVRLSGYRNYKGGFVDNDVRGIRNQNDGRIWGVNGTVLAHPTDRLSIKLTGFYQDTDMVRDVVAYNADRTPRNGDLRYDEILSPIYTNKVRAGIGTIDYDLDVATLTSVTAYQHTTSYNFLNGTNGAIASVLPVLASFGGVAPPSGTIGVGIDSLSDVKKFSQEVRLTSTGTGPFEWIVGGYYVDEKDSVLQTINVTDANGAFYGPLAPALAFNLPITYREHAVFGNATYKFGDRFDVTGGIRVGRLNQTFRQRFFGSDAAAFNALFALSGFPPTPAETSKAKGSKTVVNYLATARFHPSDDTMLFARFATGFRPGGPNVQVLGLPTVYDPDSTRNYEAGLKTKFWGNKGSLDIVGYYTDWDDIIISIGAGGIAGLGNGGDARVYGVESTLTVRPVARLSLTANLAYSNAKIDKVDPRGAGTVAVGDILPNNPRWSGSLLADYRFPIDGTWQGVIGGNARHAALRHTNLQSGLVPDYILPRYTMFDLRGGVQSERVDIDLFVRNLTDKRAQLGAYTYFGVNEITVQRPRTYGMAVTVRY